MAYTYTYCDGATPGSREVTQVEWSSCAFKYLSGSKEPYEDYCEFWEEKIRFTIPTPAPVDIRVYYNQDYRFDGTWGGNSEYTMNNYADILAGNTYVELTFYCYIECGMDMGGGGYGWERQYLENTLLQAQPTIPDCWLTPSGVTCTIGISGYTVTDCQTRGDSTGSIYVCITGATGNTTWNLNGIAKVSAYTGNCYTFTGLTANAYSVAITDATGCTVQASYTVLDGEFRTGDFSVIYPTGLTAVENPIQIVVGTKLNNPNPKPSITTLTVAGALSDGFSLTFNLTSPYVYTQTYYARAFPNKPNFFLASTLNNQYGVPVGSNTLSEICTSLSDALSNDAVIPKVYFINNTGTVVTLQAKENGSKFDLDASNVIASTTGITVSQTQAGVDYCDGQITDNYSISCEVLVNVDYTNEYPLTGDTTDYNKIAEMILPFQENNIHIFDISSILKTQVSTPKPNTVLSGASYLSTPMQPYYVKLSELYPLVANTNTVKKRYKTQTPIKWVINSSLDRTVANNMDDYINVPVEFLTNSPSPKQIQRNSKEFLYFVLPKDYGTDLSVRGDMYFYDGTQVTGQTFFNISTGSTNRGGVMCLNLSYDKLGLASFEQSGTTNRKIKRLEVAVYASGGTIQYTQTKQFRFEIDEMPRKFSIFFQNALSFYDAIDFVGVVEETIERSTGSYTVPIDYNVDGSMGAGQKHLATYNTKITKKLICNTGWLDENHFDWLMEMMKTNNIYSAQTADAHYLNLTGWKYLKSSLDDLFDIECTFEYTVWENNVSI